MNVDWYRTGIVPGGIDLIRGLVPEGLVGSLLVVESEVRPQAPYGLSDTVIFSEIHLLIFYRAPQAFHEDVVEGPASPIHTDGNARGFQHADKARGRELAPLIIMYPENWTGG